MLYTPSSISRFCTRDPAPFPGSHTSRDLHRPYPRRFPPVVPSLCVYRRMTRLAQRDQITQIMRTTFRERLLMVYLFSKHDNSTFITQLTEGMLRSIQAAEYGFSFPHLQLIYSNSYSIARLTCRC